MTPKAILEGRAIYARTRTPIYPRSRDEIAALLDGSAVHEPGLVEVSTWRPWYESASGVQEAHFLGAVADLLPATTQPGSAASARLTCR
jgi:hypothetical protein